MVGSTILCVRHRWGTCPPCGSPSPRNQPLPYPSPTTPGTRGSVLGHPSTAAQQEGGGDPVRQLRDEKHHVRSEPLPIFWVILAAWHPSKPGTGQWAATWSMHLPPKPSPPLPTPHCMSPNTIKCPFSASSWDGGWHNQHWAGWEEVSNAKRFPALPTGIPFPPDEGETKPSTHGRPIQSQ